MEGKGIRASILLALMLVLMILCNARMAASDCFTPCVQECKLQIHRGIYIRGCEIKCGDGPDVNRQNQVDSGKEAAKPS
ncbi:hypothetical protein NC653_023430 [Populus alba x Populus x berolinensis]|uniref:Uncharacterized protein n=1 Tax=Populus alba x Populus x berolinensis TaxID=444605 RepID=A0AAD6MHG0_9ROSI|nr:hypothetical protein NC653_023430 [Populus alba x Populus x berolinensis]